MVLTTVVRSCSGRRNLQKGFLLCSKLLKKTKLLGLRIIQEHTYHQQYFTGMLFHLSFFKYFSYRRCISQNFFTNDCGKHKRKSLHHFMSCQHPIKVRYHALELYNASKLDRASASGSHLGARVHTPFFLRYHTPPLF